MPQLAFIYCVAVLSLLLLANIICYWLTLRCRRDINKAIAAVDAMTSNCVAEMDKAIKEMGSKK